MYLYLLQHIILGGMPATLAGPCTSAQNSATPLCIPLGFSHLARQPSRPTSNKHSCLSLEGWEAPAALAGLQIANMTPFALVAPTHWTRLLSRSQFEWSCPQDYCIDTYVIHLAWLVLICLLRFALTSDPNVFRYTSILNYIIVRHWYLLALVNSHLTFSAILWNHRFAIIYTLCMHLSLIMLCLLGFKSAHN